jgi:hypothetical protein
VPGRRRREKAERQRQFGAAFDGLGGKFICQFIYHGDIPSGWTGAG